MEKRLNEKIGREENEKKHKRNRKKKEKNFKG